MGENLKIISRDYLSLLNVKNEVCDIVYKKSVPLKFKLPSNRTDYIFIKLLLFDFVSFKDVADTFDLDRKSLDNDSKKINTFLRAYGLKLVGYRGKGYFLDGKLGDKNIFFICFLTKLLIEEYFYSDLIKCSISFSNVLNEFLDCYLPKEDLEKLKRTAKILNEKFKLFLGLYAEVALEATLIYSYLRFDMNNYDCVFMGSYPSKYLEVAKKIEKLKLGCKYIQLPTIYLISTYFEKGRNIIQPQDVLINSILEKYSLKKDKKIIYRLEKLLNQSFFKYSFNVRNFNKLPLNIPKYLKILNRDFNFFLHKLNFKVFMEDSFFIILFLYGLLRKKTIGDLRNKRIIIIDGTSGCWIGEYIKMLFEEQGVANIVIISYSFVKESFDLIESANYVLISNLMEIKSISNIATKKIFFNYQDYSNIEFFFEYVILDNLGLEEKFGGKTQR